MHHDYLSPVNEYWRHRWQQEKSARQQLEEETERYTRQQLREDAEVYLKGLFRSEYYGYEYYIENAKIVETYITVLGRAVEPEDSISEPCDRLILPRAAS